MRLLPILGRMGVVPMARASLHLLILAMDPELSAILSALIPGIINRVFLGVKVSESTLSSTFFCAPSAIWIRKSCRIRHR